MNLQERLLALAEKHDVPPRVCTGCGRKFHAVEHPKGGPEQCEDCDSRPTTLRANAHGQP